MAWFLNMYRCERCKKVWRDEWSCTCEDDCPHCGLRHTTPFHSEDLTEVVAPEGQEFIALRSPENAEHDPDYEELGRFSTHAKAEAFLASHEVG
jgi:hypothetical protein